MLSESPLRPFHVIIIGARLAGLSAAVSLAQKGHKVTVVEAAPGLNEIGAGVQMPPSSARILDAYGLTAKFQEKVNLPIAWNFFRYDSGEKIGSTALHPQLTERYGYPYWLIHRADYQHLLYDGAKEAGATILFSSAVESVNQDIPEVNFRGGGKMKADLIVGADGIRSRTRRAIIPEEVIEPNLASICVYRAIVPASIIASDQEISHLLKTTNVNCWIGPHRHFMGYPIRRGALYNLVMSYPGRVQTVGKWSEQGDPNEMREQYRSYHPTLSELPLLRSWSSESGRVVVIGDAAHAMLPFLAQGAATAIEDGAVLGECLARAKHVGDIPAVLRAFEKIRKPRCEEMKRGARYNDSIWHMPDGDEQTRRDQTMKYDMVDLNPDGDIGEQNPNQWSDVRGQVRVLGYDAIGHAKETLEVLTD